MSAKKQFAFRILTIVLILAMICAFSAPSFALLPDYEMSSSYKTGVYYQNLLNVRLTGDMRTDIVAVAKSQLGYHEGASLSDMAGDGLSASNYTEYTNFFNYYASTYYKNTYNYQREGWCGMFVSFCAAMAKVPNSIIYKSAETSPQAFRLYGSLKNEGADYKTVYDLPINGGSYMPLPGDIVHFGYSSSTNPSNVSYRHIGIVEYSELTVEDGRNVLIVHTIEGNSSDRVKEHAWRLYEGSTGWIYSGMYIAGFGIPAYETSVTAPYAFDIGSYSGTTLRAGSVGIDVYNLQRALSILNAAKIISSKVERTGVMDDATLSAVRAYQKAKSLEVDGVVGAMTWTSIRTAVSKFVEEYKNDFIMDGSTLLLYRGSDKSVVLPDGCKTIASMAFTGTSLTSLTTPIGLQKIEANAFYGITSLKDIIHHDTKQATDAVSVSSVGNSAYTSAAHSYDIPVFKITFNVGEMRIITYCPYGSIPEFMGSVERCADDANIYYFVGWDKPLSAVSGDAVYTAQYFTVPNVPVSLTVADAAVKNEDEISVSVTADNLIDLSSFSFDVNYIEYSDILTFIGYSTEIDDIKVDITDGLLTVSKAENGELLNGKQTLLTLRFAVDEKLKNGELYLSLSSSGTQSFCCTDGENTYPLRVSCGCGTITVDRTFSFDPMLDFDGNGVLNISDVTAMLDCLSGAETPDPGQINAELNISNVTHLLDVLSSLA